MDTSTDNDGCSKLQKDLLWGLYLEYRRHARHAETLRTNAVNLMLVVSSGLITVITFDKEINQFDLPLGILVSFLGLVTMLFAASYAELFFRNRERAERILARLDSLYFEDPDTLAQLKAAAYRGGYRFQRSRKITGSTHVFWLLLPIVVLIIGGFLTYLALFSL